MSYLGQAALKNSELKRFDVTSSTSATHVLSWTAPNEQSLFITINGVKQQDDAYSIAGSPTTITLTDPLVATDKMEVIGIVDIGVITIVGDNSVSSNKLADNAVTTGKILDGTIVAGDLANLAVTDAKLADNAVTDAKLADNAVTLAKMAGLARGSIIYGDASGDPAALTKGTADQVLKSDGTDIAWGADAGLPTQNAAAAGKYLVTDGTTASWDRESPNLLINGDFDVWQRGTTFNVVAGTNIYTADRWRFEGNGFTGSLIQQAFNPGQTDVPDGPGYFARWINNTSALAQQYTQRIETTPPHKLSGQQVTFSCWLKSASGTIADGNLLWVGGSGNVGAITTTWAKYTTTWTIPTLSGSYYTVGFNCPANETLLGGVDIAHCQVEFGGVATTFKALSLAQELRNCYRYYERWGAGGGPQAGTGARVPWGTGQMMDTDTGWIGWMYKQPKRAAPSFAWNGTNSDWNIVANGSGYATNGQSQAYSDYYGALLYIDSSVAHGSAHATFVYPTTSNAYWAADAEL